MYKFNQQQNYNYATIIIEDSVKPKIDEIFITLPGEKQKRQAYTMLKHAVTCTRSQYLDKSRNLLREQRYHRYKKLIGEYNLYFTTQPNTYPYIKVCCDPRFFTRSIRPSQTEEIKKIKQTFKQRFSIDLLNILENYQQWNPEKNKLKTEEAASISSSHHNNNNRGG